MLLFFIRLGSISVYQVAEARNAECAREMLERKDWIVPVFNGTLRTDKPALEYFAMMIAYSIHGVSEGSARFFSAMCGLLLVLSTFLVAFKHIGQQAAWWSALALLASPHLVAQFRLATPDPYLVLFDTLALYCFIEGWLSPAHKRTKEGWWYGGMYIFLGLALWAKGPVGILLPALTLLIFLVWKKSLTWKTVLRLRPWGILLTLLFSVPWYILVHIKTNGAWTRGFFIEHNMHRFSSAMGGHGGIFLITGLFVFAGMLPFSVFIVRTLGHVWKRRHENDLLLFSLIAFTCVVVFYAICRTKLINYTVPCYPFLALMTGAFLSHITQIQVPPKGLKIPLILLAIISIAIPAGIFFWTRSAGHLHRFEHITWFFILYPVGTWIAFCLLLQKRLYAGLSVLVAAFILSTLIIINYPYPLLDAQTPVRKAQALLNKNCPVAAYRSFNDAFIFYVGRPIRVMEDTVALRQFLDHHAEALIISNDRDQKDLKNMTGIKLIRQDHEIFNTHVSYIYQKIHLPAEEENIKRRSR
jgi:4-amino-4-deoxy-L-arabinose transferase-like glycosyltransferase